MLMKTTGKSFPFLLMNIADMNHKQGKWKHVFHRGNRSNAGIAAPGQPSRHIHKHKQFGIYMNTSKNL